MRLSTALITALILCVGLPVRAAEVDRLPNVILVVVDTLRADRLGCYGYERPTSPNIDRLAAEGVVFENCYSVASWTLPSFASMWTGLLPAVHGCVGLYTPLPENIPTLPQRMTDRGYYCAAVVANPFLGAKYGFGRGFDFYDDYSVFLDTEVGLLAADPGRDRGVVSDTVTGQTVTQQAINLLRLAKKSEKPLFLFIHYYDPHDSYIPPPPFDRAFVDPKYSGPIDGRQIPSMRQKPPTGDDLQRLIDLQDGEIAYNDKLIGRFIAKLDETLDPTNTLVILVSDHGEAFAEHGRMLHGNSAYREELWVPMIWRWRGTLPGGHRVKSPVATIDMTATLNHVLGLRGLPPQQGASLWPALRGGQGSQERMIISDRAIAPGVHIETSEHHWAVTRGNLRLHGHFGQSPDEGAKWEGFDVGDDPREHRDVFAGQRDRFLPLKDQLLQTWRECQELRLDYARTGKGRAAELTDKERKRIEGLGYLNIRPSVKPTEAKSEEP